jgi:hypothetical protein
LIGPDGVINIMGAFFTALYLPSLYGRNRQQDFDQHIQAEILTGKIPLGCSFLAI